MAWVAVGDENYGEGSSREHAAMEPRFMGGAGDHRPLVRPHRRDQPQEAGRAAALVRRSRRLRRDRARTTASRCSGSPSLAPDAPVRARIHHADGTTTDFECTHTMSQEHIEWFKAGSALNIIRLQQQSN